MIIKVTDGTSGLIDITGLRAIKSGESLIVPDEFVNMKNIKNAADAGLITLTADKDYNASDSVSSSTSTTYQDKTILTTNSIEGVFWIEWSAELTNTNSNATSWIRFMNDTDNAILNEVSPNFKNISGYLLFCGFAELTFTGSPRTFKIQYKAESNTAQIRNARIRIWRRS